MSEFINKTIINGIATGLITSLIFNPIDKIIYLQIINKSNFFNKKLWFPYNSHLKNIIYLFHGSSLALTSKVISSGIYFTLLDHLTIISKKILPNEKTQNISSSVTLGIITGILTNPLNIVKYYSWTQNNNNNNIKYNIIKIYNKKHINGFMYGINYIIFRDTVFNYFYITYKKKDLIYNMFLNSSILILVSPINYIKNYKYYNVNLDKNNSIYEILKNLYNNIKHQNGIKHKTIHLCNQFAIGYGTFLTGFRITFGQIIYNYLNNH